MVMSMPHTWKHGWADAYAYRNGAIADEFLDLVVKPSVAALEKKHLELASSDNLAIAGFAASDHRDLINKTNMAFCLSIQSLWEQQIRRYLIVCVQTLSMEGVSVAKLEKEPWGKDFNRLFLKVRGLGLSDFTSYKTLSFLHLLGNACRHGDGPSSRELSAIHPCLWPEWARQAASIQHLQIPLELLESFVDAIVLFWMDMEILGLESFANEDPRVVARIAQLRNDRVSRIA
jgi:hypothetical protein